MVVSSKVVLEVALTNNNIPEVILVPWVLPLNDSFILSRCFRISMIDVNDVE